MAGKAPAPSIMPPLPWTMAAHAPFYEGLPGGVTDSGEPALRSYLAQFRSALTTPASADIADSLVLQVLKGYWLQRMLRDEAAQKRLAPLLEVAGFTGEKLTARFEECGRNPVARARFFGDTRKALEFAVSGSDAMKEVTKRQGELRAFRRSYKNLMPAPQFLDLKAKGEASSKRKADVPKFDGMTWFDGTSVLKDEGIPGWTTPVTETQDAEKIEEKAKADDTVVVEDEAPEGGIDIHRKVQQAHVWTVLPATFADLRAAEEAARAAQAASREQIAVDDFAKLEKSLYKEYGHIADINDSLVSLDRKMGRQAGSDGSSAENEAWVQGKPVILRAAVQSNPDWVAQHFPGAADPVAVVSEWFEYCSQCTLTEDEWNAAVSASGKKNVKADNAASRWEVFQWHCDNVAKKPLVALGSSFKYGVNGVRGELDLVLLDVSNKRALATVEVKLNPADLVYARRQRVKLCDAMHALKLSGSGAEAEVAGVDAKKINPKGITFAGCLLFADGSSAGGVTIPATAFMHLTEQPLQRCGFATGADPTSRGKLPVYAKYTHIMVRNVATALVGSLNPTIVEQGKDAVKAHLFSEKVFLRTNFKFAIRDLATQLRRWFEEEVKSQPAPAANPGMAVILTPQGVLEELASDPRSMPVIRF